MTSTTERLWNGYEQVEPTFRTLRVSQIIRKDSNWDFKIKEFRNGLIFIELFDYGLIGSNVIGRIYQELGLVVQALEPLDSLTRIWFGSAKFNECQDSIHPLNRDKPTIGDKGN